MKQINKILSELTQIATKIQLAEQTVKASKNHKDYLIARNSPHIPISLDVQISECEEIVIEQKMKFLTANRMLNQLIEKL